MSRRIHNPILEYEITTPANLVDDFLFSVLRPSPDSALIEQAVALLETEFEGDEPQLAARSGERYQQCRTAVITKDGEVVSAAVFALIHNEFNKNDRALMVLYFATSVNHRRKALGSLLLARLRCLAQSKGHKVFFTMVLKTAAAMGFWEEMQFSLSTASKAAHYKLAGAAKQLQTSGTHLWATNDLAGCDQDLVRWAEKVNERCNPRGIQAALPAAGQGCPELSHLCDLHLQATDMDMDVALVLPNTAAAQVSHTPGCEQHGLAEEDLPTEQAAAAAAAAAWLEQVEQHAAVMDPGRFQTPPPLAPSFTFGAQPVTTPPERRVLHAKRRTALQAGLTISPVFEAGLISNWAPCQPTVIQQAELDMALPGSPLAGVVHRALQQGCLLIQLSEGVRDALKQARCQAVAQQGSRQEGVELLELPGKAAYVISQQDNPTAMGKVIPLMDDLARKVLYAAASAPAGVGSPAGFRQLLEAPPATSPGSGILHANVYKPLPDGTASCRCHEQHVDQGLLTVISSDTPGLQVLSDDGQLWAVPHQDGAYVVVLPGLTLDVALRRGNGTQDIKARRHSVVPLTPGTPRRVSLAYKLRAHPDAVLDPRQLLRPARTGWGTGGEPEQASWGEPGKRPTVEELQGMIKHAVSNLISLDAPSTMNDDDVRLLLRSLHAFEDGDRRGDVPQQGLTVRQVCGQLDGSIHAQPAAPGANSTGDHHRPQPPAPPPSFIELRVETTLGTFPLTVFSRSTVHQLRLMVVNAENDMHGAEANGAASPGPRRVVFGGMRLAPHRTLEGCGVGSGSTLRLEAGGWRVKVRMEDGKRLALDMERDETAESVKAMIRDITGIPAYKQRILFDGMRCYGRLADFGFRSGDQVDMMLELIGD